VTRADGGVLHVTNGDAAVPTLRAHGVEGPILAWRDILHEDPVPAVPGARLRQLRAGFLAGEGGLAYDEVLAELEARDDALASASRLVLWFEHDLYDQLQLVQVLASSDVPTELAQAETYIGDSDIAGLTPEPVTGEQRALARRAWAALRAPDPSELETLAAARDGELPFLGSALGRLLEEYPAVQGGLGRSERQALEAVAGGARTKTEAFAAAQAHEEARFMGDLTFFGMLDRIAPLVGRDPELRLTELGEQVLNGAADFVTSRWLGGVEIVPPRPAWRWDAAHRCLVTMLAA
jgi:hypothetical protein